MITGYNTDVEHEGVVYHVQTEDKGLDSPIILSLVYSGGAILASKRAPYKDLLASGFSEAALAERLKRQHWLICAAIHSGRIEDLKRMSSQGSSAASVNEEPAAESSLVDEIDYDMAPSYQPAPSEVKERLGSEPLPEPSTEASPEDLGEVSMPPDDVPPDDMPPDDRRLSPLGDIPVGEQGLVVSLLDEEDFQSGASMTVRVLVSRRTGNAEKPLNNVAVSLKVLGTTFRPQIYSTKTQKNGVATIHAKIPAFTSGRAAVLVRAVAHGQTTEIRRIAHPGK